MGHLPRLPSVRQRCGYNVIYLVTICVSNRDPVWRTNASLKAFKAAVARLQHWIVLAAVLMPDHLHVIVSPTDARDCQAWEFFGSTENVGFAETKRRMGLAAGLF